MLKFYDDFASSSISYDPMKMRVQIGNLKNGRWGPYFMSHKNLYSCDGMILYGDANHGQSGHGLETSWTGSQLSISPNLAAIELYVSSPVPIRIMKLTIIGHG